MVCEHDPVAGYDLAEIELPVRVGPREQRGCVGVREVSGTDAGSVRGLPVGFEDVAGETAQTRRRRGIMRACNERWEHQADQEDAKHRGGSPFLTPQVATFPSLPPPIDSASVRCFRRTS